MFESYKSSAGAAFRLFSVSFLFFITCRSWAGDEPMHPTGDESQFELRFEHYDGLGYPMHVVHRGSSTSTLPRAERPLDVHYHWKSNDYTLDDLLARTATTGFLVLKDGKIVSERYFWNANDHSRFLSESLAKSFTSTLVGLAIADGKIANVHRLITDYLPELKGSGYEHATIEDVLEMTSGVNLGRLDVFWKSTVDGDLRFNDFAKVLGSVDAPGSKFVYDNIDSQVLGTLVTRVTGESLSDYMSRKIWQPLGMEQDALWQADRDGQQGMEAAFCCLNAALRDYARFGLLFANEGKWNGRQIVPERWVAEATAPAWQQTVPGGSLGYAYQWWTPPGNEHAFAAWGAYQQYIYVSPADHVVIVKTSAYQPDDASLETFAALNAICQALRTP